ncbi:p-hydroxyphenylacetate 3-hydroxylase, reductase component [Delftia tsuruhatensis]|uniref:flavin reductase family protein n=1 Tax=Delftia tsuruhatensis TaxID=180282 RepID=UPI001E6B5806|nr:flavin reductase family protein [Delftia tsuruhatensis]CAB5695087.1 p-hydroxyphenylacetate 3-hydroxylase, reductase component [Delftia tsuruhatensis]CAC9687010.1 p-hydroxyphenylacetate 3-hydroxylase, reductase component [Delftia tsuruhatensis]
MANALDPRALRNAFGHYTTGVVVVTTTTAQGHKVGVTVNSFTSVSLDPPLVLFCLLNRSNAYQTWAQARHFTMNILTADQQAVSNAFARPSQSSPWDLVAHTTGANGCPLVSAAAASLECALHEHLPGGDHLILVGRVTAVHTAASHAVPLAFYRGQYGTYWGVDFGAPPADSSLSDMVMAGFG